MPQGPAHLRHKFMTEEDDGIRRCETIIRNEGGSVKQGWITYPDGPTYSDDFHDAVQYLIEEWDYAYGDGPPNRD